MKRMDVFLKDINLYLFEIKKHLECPTDEEKVEQLKL